MFFKYKLIVYALTLVVLSDYQSYAQEQSSDIPGKVTQFPEKLLNRLSKKQMNISDKLEKQTIKYLGKLSRRERRLQKHLAKIDSLQAKELFGDAQVQYSVLAQKMKVASRLHLERTGGTYLPYLDSIDISLKFLNKNPELMETSGDITNKLQSSLGVMNQLQNRLKQSEDIKLFVKQRGDQIKQAFSKYQNLPKGLTRGYGDLAKNAYYYQAQLKECKELINDPNKMEQKALELLNKLPAFQSFMAKNSLLSSLFRMPANYGTPVALAGLQTRDDVQQLIGSRLATGGPNAQAVVQENLQNAQSQLSQLKDKVNKLGGSNSDLPMPDFKPNTQKTKRFKDRIELGTNLQTVRSDRYFPATTDLGASVGYKLNDKSVIGVGASYKLGLGRGLQHIAFTSEGIGLRSFMDYRLKSSFWITGGAEVNYRARFDHVEILKNVSNWQQSVLVGLSKKYQVSKKIKGNAQLLYDALWKQQTPRTSAVVFRLGYQL